MNRIEVKKVHTFLGHTDSIYSLERIDESKFVSTGGDGMVVQWDLKEPGDGEVLAKLNNASYAFHFIHEKQQLIVGENFEGVHLVDIASKKEVASVNLGKYQIFDIKYHMDLIWVALSSGELVILDQELKVVRKNVFSSERIRSIDFTSGSLALGLSDNSIKIIDSKTLAVKKELKAHKNSVFNVTYHPSGKYLASVGRDAHLKIWDTEADYVLRESIPAHLYTVNHLVFSRNGKYFVTGSMDKAIKLWDAYNFRLLKVLDKERHAGHGNSVNKLLWMDYQDLLVTCSDDRSISVWDLTIEE